MKASHVDLIHHERSFSGKPCSSIFHIDVNVYPRVILGKGLASYDFECRDRIPFKSGDFMELKAEITKHDIFFSPQTKSLQGMYISGHGGFLKWRYPYKINQVIRQSSIESHGDLGIHRGLRNFHTHIYDHIRITCMTYIVLI